MTIHHCRLCRGETLIFFQAQKPFRADYYRCQVCDLVQMDELSLLSAKSEKSHYKMHENHKREQGYIDFLDRCLVPTMEYLEKGMHGLDFGCGPYPMLAELMGERGFPMDYFDPYFFPETAHLKENYTFVTATEVVEHFNDPTLSWRQLVNKVAPGGILSIMTSILYSGIEFEGWHYRRDETHVCFYSPKTVSWLAQAFGLDILSFPKNVVIFRKPIK